MKDMLDRLAKADPATYKGYKYLCDCIVWQSWERGEDRPIIEERILQGELQEAIQAHRSADFLNDWFWKIEYLDCDIYEATVYRRTGYISKERHDSPAAALLTAYLSAIEEQA